MNKISKIFIFVGIFLILTSNIILLHNNHIEKTAGIKSSEVLNILKDSINTQQITINNQEKIIKEMETTTINGNEYIGTITIPSINLELPVIKEYTIDKLNIAPCRYYGSINTNDLIICGH